MNNGRFALSMHILTLLARSEGEYLSSEYLAGSININPVLVRRELGNLRDHGLVESREGKGGGSILARPARQIRLSEVYQAVRSEYILGHTRNSPNPSCPIGRQINEHLNDLYAEVEDALLRKLSRQTLAEFDSQFG